MSGVALLVFSVLVALGAATVLTMGYAALRRRKSLDGTLTTGTKKASATAEITRITSGFFSATNTEIAEKFIGAGFYNTRLAPYYFFLKYTVGAIGIMIILFTGESPFLEDFTRKIMWLSLLIVMVVIAPDMYLEMRRRALANKITRKLPYLLDIMGVCVKTGMTVETTLFYLTSEMAAFDRDIAYVLKRLRDRAQTVGLDKALHELHIRIPAPEVHSFVITLTQSMKHGTSIYDVLSTLAKDIREIQLLTLEEKAGKLSSKMSIPLILFIMMPIVVLITAPGVMRMLG
ncbi:type II secretion system F family protein [Enterovibrio norvegicus]|uniref:Biotin synthase n=1 Tax=Enterovibrio norvegicus TaxID=188144 RepID=A0A2N7L806_9GAMM|nr:type II secretion system F family protein [Enterovibrio norvegicus]PMN71902.1 biotin synthase [Enterovibrio norvegicus]PMN90266.1 biotin synthase [Enterovibrio norvegicus]